jgi:cell wall assembly regulator SMI1
MDAAGVTDATQALEALLAELTSRGSPLANFLEPGLPAAHIETRLAELGAEPHSDVIKLYAWHNGFDRFRVPVSDNGIVSLVPFEEFNPLEETADVYFSWRQAAERDGATPVRHIDGLWRTIDPEDMWSRRWFPIFQGPGSEVIFIDNRDVSAGSVWLHPVQDSPRRLYGSLAEAMDTIRQALVDGRLQLDSDGVFTHESYLASGLEI